MAEAIDSFLTELSLKTIDTLTPIVKVDDDSIKELLTERLNIFMVGDSNKRVELVLSNYSLSYPTAYREGFFGRRVIKRRVKFDASARFASDSTYILKKQYSLEATFPTSELKIVETDNFKAQVESYSVSYLLWEPIVLALGSIGLTYLFFIGR